MQLQPAVPRHDGTAQDPNSDFPIAPDPAIGRLLSAQTNRKQGDRGFLSRLGGLWTTFVGQHGIERHLSSTFGKVTHRVLKFEECDRLEIELADMMSGGKVRYTH